MTSPTPTVQKKSKKSKSSDPTVKLPKGKFRVPDEEAGEKQGEIAAKPANEEVSQKEPVIDTKPDIFQTTPHDGIIIVNYPNINAKKEKDSHILETLDALNGTRREGNASPEMPPTAIEVLEKILGKDPDQNKPKGSNYGRLAQDFKFPSNKPSKNNPPNTNNDVTASSSKNSGDNKEVDQDDLDKKERTRRRKSNLNPFAPMNHEVNGDTEIPYQKKKRRSSQQLIASETAVPYNYPPNNGFEPSAYYEHGNTSYPPPNHAERTIIPNWEEFQTKIAEEIVSRIESGFQKGVDTLTLEIKNTLVEHMSEDSGANGKKNDEEINLQKLQDQILQELRNNHQEMRNTYDQLIHKHEEMQNRHLDQVSNLQTVQGGDSQSSISQHHAELQTMHHNLQTELKNGLRGIHDEFLKMLERQQQLGNEIKSSQALQHRLSESESEINKLRMMNTNLTTENTRLSDENHNIKLQYDERKRQQETSISDLRTEISSYRDKALRADKELDMIRTTVRSLETQKATLDNMNATLETKNATLENKIRNLLNENNEIFNENNALQKHKDELNVRLLQIETDLAESKLKNKELENKILMEDSSSKTKEDNLRKQLQEANQEIIELRAHQRRVKDLENEIKTLKSNESVQLKSKDKEIDGLNNQIAQLNRRVNDLDNSRSELLQNNQKEIASLRASKQELLELRDSNKTLEDEISNARKHNKELETKVDELEKSIVELKKIRQDFENVNRKVKSMVDFEAKYNEKVEEFNILHLRVKELEFAERDLKFMSEAKKELLNTVEALQAENKRLLENNRSQKSVSSTSNTYSYGSKMNGVIEYEDRMISRDHSPLYNNQPNGNLEQPHYNSRMKPLGEYNPQQTFSQSPANGGINLTQQTTSMPHMINGAAQQQQPSQHQPFIPQTQSSSAPPQHMQPGYLPNGSLSQPPTQPQLQAYVPIHSNAHVQSAPIRSNTPVLSGPIRSNTPVPSQKMPQKQDQLQLQQSPLPSRQTQPNQEQSSVKQESKTHSRQGSRSNNIGSSGKKQRNQNSKKKERERARRNSTTTENSDNPWTK
ncbi:80_t:CDS:2, partial [Dentiscutata erythropus]